MLCTAVVPAILPRGRTEIEQETTPSSSLAEKTELRNNSGPYETIHNPQPESGRGGTSVKTPALAPRPAQALPAVLCPQVDGGHRHQALAFPAVSHPLTLAHAVGSLPGSSKTEAREREQVTSRALSGWREGSCGLVSARRPELMERSSIIYEPQLGPLPSYRLAGSFNLSFKPKSCRFSQSLALEWGKTQGSAHPCR